MGVAAQTHLVGIPLVTGHDAHRVGPNAIIQTANALTALYGVDVKDAVFDRAGFGWMAGRMPDDMVRAEAVNALNRAVHEQMSDMQAVAVMRNAGERTARYILENRIPKLAQRVLARLPSRLAIRLLLKAIGKNAWTFAGSADIKVGRNWIALIDNPVCLGRSGYSGCVWHEAVFATLFDTIIGDGISVRETHCVGRGDPYCRFEIGISGR